MKYRAEIDGLRALAVAPVILFHAGLAGFHGGFVGVDVFFVISGYLITSIIAREMEQGDFSLRRFYERRARRILPALFLVVVVTLPFGVAWIVPELRDQYFKSIAGVALFASNLVFWRQSGYFDAAAETKPLLHTWSLGVEEQFYVFFPLVLLVLLRGGRRRGIALLAVVALASLALAQWAVARSPGASFFLLPTRAWELLAGALVALSQPKLPLFTRNALSVAGLAMVIAAVMFFDQSTPTPSLLTLVPVVGSVAIIACAQPDTLVGRVLGAPALVGLGLISYSAYLWHQPLFALARARSIDEPGGATFALLVVASLALAYLTWRYVETPFRKEVGRRAIVTFAVTLTTVLLAASVAFLQLLQPSEAPDPTHGRCNVGAGECFAKGASSRQVALWGDSYADAFATSLGRHLAARGIALRLFVRNGCPSLVNVMRNESGPAGQRDAEQCAAHNRMALEVIQREKFDAVVLTSAYQNYLRKKNGAGQSLLVSSTDVKEDSERLLPERLKQTILATGKRVLLVTPHPVVWDFPAQRKKLYFEEARQVYADYAGATTARATVLSQLDGVPFEEVDGRELLCAAAKCPIVAGGRILLYDGSHIGPELAEKLATRIADVITRTGAP